MEKSFALQLKKLPCKTSEIEEENATIETALDSQKNSTAVESQIGNELIVFSDLLIAF